MIRLWYALFAALVIAASMIEPSMAAQAQPARAPAEDPTADGALPALPPDLAQQLQDLVGARERREPSSDATSDATIAPDEERRARNNAAGHSTPVPSPGPAAFERDLSARAGAPLRLFGRDAFADAVETAPVTGAIRDSYVIGYDDEIVVELRGQISRSLTGRVGRDGTLLLPGLPPVPAVGRSFGEFRSAMADAAHRALGNIDVFVSLGTVHQISVLVTGAVEHPGVRRLDAFATVLNAIGGALGPDASLRTITVTHDGVSRRVDLYDLLIAGREPENLALSEGDRVFVPTLSATVAISGQVVRPAVYEIPVGGISAAELVRLAGGYIRPSGNRLIRLSLDRAGRDQATEIAAGAAVRLMPSDVLLVQRSENVQLGIVELEGNVRVPGPRSTSGVHRLGDLIDADQLNVDPYLPFVVILTVDPATLSRSFVGVDFGDAAARRDDYILKTGDTVIVLGKDDIRYLGSSEVQAVLSGRTPASRSAGIVRTAASAALAEETHVARPPDAADKPSMPASPDPGGGCAGLRALQTVAALDRSGRFVNAVRGAPVADEMVVENAVPCPPVFAKYPDLLPFVLEHAITVDGEVRQPGIYPVAGGASLAEIVRVAGGITRTADLRGIEVSHFAVDQRTGRSDIRRDELALSEADFSKVALNPGDGVRFNPVFNERDDGPILLTGEVRRPGLFDIRRGEHLSAVYARAGGLTEAAFPYGAVLTRVRVRQAEEEGRQRTVRELQIELGSAVSGTGASQSAEISSQAQQALATLQSMPALGRMVFEADPAMLELHPELDVVLEPGDRIYMPKRPATVTILGDVLNPSTQQFRDGLSPSDYIERAGGFVSTADTSRVFVILPNGQAEPAGASFWNRTRVSVPPGSTIVVPRELSGDSLTLVRDIATALGQAALTAASIAVINH